MVQYPLVNCYKLAMSEYQMKKSLRKTPGAPKSYAQPEEYLQPNQVPADKKDREGHKQSIFQHKNWLFKEKIKLMVFLSFYQVLSDWNSERKSIYLYKHLSNFLKRGRTPEQCKNIHSLLKRKFNTIQQIVEQMQRELQSQQYFDKFLLKYEKDIVNFQMQNKLFELVNQEQRYEPISIKRATQKEQQIRNNERSYDTVRRYHTTQERVQKGIKDISLDPAVKVEQFGESFEGRRQELLNRCNFFFKEWLLCTSVLEQRRQGQGETKDE